MRKAYLNKIERTKFEISAIEEEIKMFMEKELLFQLDNADLLKRAERRLKRKDWFLTILLIPKGFIV
jgi:hypothetical protein